MRKTTVTRSAMVLAALLIAAGQQVAYGDIVTTEVFDTSALISSSAGPFELAFVLTDGSGTGDGNNTVTLSNFLFGVGGSAGSVDTSLSTGGVSGDLASGVSLVDSSFLNIFASSFTPGSLLSFRLGLTTNVDPGGTPDELSLVLLQGSGPPLPVPTTDPSGLDSFLTVNIDSTQPTVSTFALAIPEPSSLLLIVVSSLAALACITRRRDRTRGKSEEVSGRS